MKISTSDGQLQNGFLDGGSKCTHSGFKLIAHAVEQQVGRYKHNIKIVTHSLVYYLQIFKVCNDFWYKICQCHSDGLEDDKMTLHELSQKP